MAEATTTTTTTVETTANGTVKLGPAVKIDVTEIAKPYRDEVRAAIRDKCGGVGPKLVAFLANTVRKWLSLSMSMTSCVCARVCVSVYLEKCVSEVIMMDGWGE